MVTREDGVAGGRRRVGTLWFVLGIAVAIPATIFALSNVEPTTIEFAGWEAEVPLYLVIGASLFAGIVIGAALASAIGVTRRRARRRQRKAVSAPSATPSATGAEPAQETLPRSADTADLPVVDDIATPSAPNDRP
jgi:uncharacterized integral membrane protein